jgi:hypothetical protein
MRAFDCGLAEIGAILEGLRERKRLARLPHTRCAGVGAALPQWRRAELHTLPRCVVLLDSLKNHNSVFP